MKPSGMGNMESSKQKREETPLSQFLELPLQLMPMIFGIQFEVSFLICMFLELERQTKIG